MPEERAKSLEQAIDAFRSADMKDPAKAGDPADRTSKRSCHRTWYQAGDRDCQRPSVAQRHYLQNRTGSAFPHAIQANAHTHARECYQRRRSQRCVMEQFNQIQEVRNEYQPRVPRGQPRVEMTPEATLEMMGKIQTIIETARAIGLETNPSNPDLLSQIIGDLAMGKGQRDETPRKPFGAPRRQASRRRRSAASQ